MTSHSWRHSWPSQLLSRQSRQNPWSCQREHCRALDDAPSLKLPDGELADLLSNKDDCTAEDADLGAPVELSRSDRASGVLAAPHRSHQQSGHHEQNKRWSRRFWRTWMRTTTMESPFQKHGWRRLRDSKWTKRRSRSGEALQVAWSAGAWSSPRNSDVEAKSTLLRWLNPGQCTSQIKTASREEKILISSTGNFLKSFQVYFIAIMWKQFISCQSCEEREKSWGLGCLGWAPSGAGCAGGVQAAVHRSPVQLWRSLCQDGCSPTTGKGNWLPPHHPERWEKSTGALEIAAWTQSDHIMPWLHCLG